MNKVATKEAWGLAGLPTPKYCIVGRGESPDEFTGRWVVKAIENGSSIDVFVCKAPEQTGHAIQEVLKRHPEALVEQFVEGIELTVGLLEEEPLAPIHIVSKREFFDYEAKYKAPDTEHRFNTGLPQEVVESCKELARKANAVVGARDLARVDMIVDPDMHPYLLEINTLPGFTPKSLLPEAAKHAGVEFGPLLDRLVKRAWAR